MSGNHDAPAIAMGEPRERSGVAAPGAPPGVSCRIAALMASHDRREKTLRCLRSLREQQLPPGVVVTTVLVDDGSTDGTADAVRAEFPEARVLHGPGDLYWNRAMRIAVADAVREGFDYYLLLNDDTLLYPTAVVTLLETSRREGASPDARAIAVGSTEAPGRGGLTYGGWRRRAGRSPLHLEKVGPASEPSPCDTFNANCVLVPDAVMRSLGNLDPAFTHAMGDTDLGLRARRAGIASYIAPGYVGACEANANRGGWQDDSVPVLERWRRLLGPKGLPPREWLAFTARHGGPLWPAYWLNPYLKFWVGAARRLVPHRARPIRRS